MPETPAEPAKDLWTTFLDFLSQIITPAWCDLIALMPFAVMMLVLLFLLMTALRWRAAAAPNRTRVPARLTHGPLPPGVHLPGPSRWPFVVPIGAALILLALALRPRGPGTEDALPFDLPLFGLGGLVSLIAIAGWLWDAMREWRRTEGGAFDPQAAHGMGLVAAGVGAGALEPGHRVDPRASRAAAVAGTNTMAHPAIVALNSVPDRLPGELPPGIHLPGPSPWPFFAPLAFMFILFGLVLGPALILGGVVMGVIAAAGWLRDAGSEYRQTDAGAVVEPRTRDPRIAFPLSLVKVYVVIAALSVAAIVGPGVITAVISRPIAASPGPSAAPGGGAPTGPLAISAQNVAFSTDRLSVPAGKPFELSFDNQEAVPHNVAIYDGSDASAPNVFLGEVFPGPKQVIYMVPALEGGDYYFNCSVHPNMKGTLNAQ
ncbi:MAG: cupredoxin domain-containing protein [Chloroflexi bacterium]|nr:cupredoxin domain-containing protein [Chloroflexota bacterium]